MLALATPPPIVQDVPGFPTEGLLAMTGAAGQDGAALKVVYDKAWHHWVEPVSRSIIADDSLDDLGYEPIPPSRVFSMKVKYVYVGKATPMPFHLDDE